MKRAHEIGEIGEADVERDVGDRRVSSASRRAACRSRAAHQVLMRCHAEHAGEQAQEVKGADPRLARCALEINRPGASVRPSRAPPPPRGGVGGRRCGRACGRRPETSRRNAPQTSSPTSSRPNRCALRRSLCQFAEHHQLGQRRHRPRHTALERSSTRPSSGVKEKTGIRRHKSCGRACRELIAGMADQQRSGNQLERFTARAATKAAPAHIGNGVAAMHFDIRLIGWSGAAAIVEHRQRRRCGARSSGPSTAELSAGPPDAPRRGGGSARAARRARPPRNRRTSPRTSAHPRAARATEVCCA